MNFTDTFIRRPVFAIVLSLVILLVGSISYFKLPVRQYPKIDASVVSVYTTYPGASAKLMESFITSPVENALSGIDGIDYITSSSTQGTSHVAVHFNLGYNMNTAASDVSSKVQSVRSDLPSGINDPVVQKQDPNSQPTLFLNFNSGSMNSAAITDYLSRVIIPQIGTVPGVAQATIFGARQYAMRIWLDPDLMAAHAVTPTDVENALANNNQQSPSGRIESALTEYNVNVATDINTAKQFNNLVIKNVNGKLVRIKDIGKAALGPEDDRFSVVTDGKNAVVVGVIPQPSANPLAISQRVNAVLNQLKPQLPKGLNASVVWDTSKFIAASIKEVKRTVIEASIAVILVIFLFLGSLRILVIPAITIPISLIGVCALMYAMGFSINTLTLLAMVLAIGMVVDDAIVVSENIHRHIELGASPKQAAISGAREIQFAVIAMTLTLAAVFAPIGFMTDITGALFKEFAFTLASAVIVSGFIALTLSPMMCSKIMSAKVTRRGLPHLIDTVFNKVVNGYRSLLTFVLRHIIWVVCVVIAIASLVVFLYLTLPGELAPAEDMGAIMTVVSAPADANLQYTEKYTQQLEKIYDSVPEKQNYVIVNGMNGVNSAISFLVLKPWDERVRTVPQIIGSLFPQMYAITGVQAFPVNPFRLPGSDDFMPVKFVLETTGSYEQLAKTLTQLQVAASQHPGFLNVDSNLKFDQPQINVNIDRNKAADLGISMNDIGNALGLALGEPTVGHFEMDGRSYDVIPQLAAAYMSTPSAINNLNLRTATGEMVPLSNVIKINTTVAPSSLSHFQQQRAGTLSASLAPGYSLGQALQFLETTAQKILPSNMTYDFDGTSRQFMQAGSAMQQTFSFALIFIFLVLAAQFESFLDPLIVLFSIIPAIAGALIALKLIGGTMNIYTEIGLVTLVGLISKHGILMVEFANQQRERGKSLVDAIVESATIRFRPILMTTASMVLGAIPLALASGAGAVSRQQIGWVIVGGMLFGTTITLFVVPSAYIALNRVVNATFRRKNEVETLT